MKQRNVYYIHFIIRYDKGLLNTYLIFFSDSSIHVANRPPSDSQRNRRLNFE